jgi:hypothetical protein
MSGPSACWQTDALETSRQPKDPEGWGAWSGPLKLRSPGGSGINPPPGETPVSRQASAVSRVTELSQHVEQFAAWPGRINPSINRTSSEARCDGRLFYRGLAWLSSEDPPDCKGDGGEDGAVRAIEINSESAASLITK